MADVRGLFSQGHQEAGTHRLVLQRKVNQHFVNLKCTKTTMLRSDVISMSEEWNSTDSAKLLDVGCKLTSRFTIITTSLENITAVNMYIITFAKHLVMRVI